MDSLKSLDRILFNDLVFKVTEMSHYENEVLEISAHLPSLN